ncbi:MAG TPA: PIN domain-containing protein [Vicinamibacterales bacterium]|nr:PIN domain-containing protein [Vicinamibacterales bacterium]
MVVADTGAVVALLDKGDRHHAALRAMYEADPAAWILPWAILPEVDYLVATELGASAQRVWLDDLASGAFAVEWGADRDLVAAHRFAERYASLEMGLVDGAVMAVAERLRADIATLDLRHFGAVRFAHAPRLLPRDAPPVRRR